MCGVGINDTCIGCEGDRIVYNMRVMVFVVFLWVILGFVLELVSFKVCRWLVLGLEIKLFVKVFRFFFVIWLVGLGGRVRVREEYRGIEVLLCVLEKFEDLFIRGSLERSYMDFLENIWVLVR